MTPPFKIKGYDPDFCWPETSRNSLVQRWETAFAGTILRPYIQNSSAHATVIASSDHAFPLLISSHETEPQAWIHSQYTHFIRYAREETDKIPSTGLRAILRAIINRLDGMAGKISIDHAVYLNHFGISTNLWPAVSSKTITDAAQHCTQTFSDRAVILRSLDTHTCAKHIPYLRQYGFILVPCRVVYIVPTDPTPATKDFRRDLRLFNDGFYALRDGKTLSNAELQRCVELYTSLYVNKYSQHNPQYTLDFFRSARDSGFLSFMALEREGIIDGVIGTVQYNGISTCPILGYDLSKPREVGLYRRLTTAIYQKAVASGCTTVHRSSGVGKFKIARGSTAAIEYTAVYCSHLPRNVRFFWYLLEKICSGIAVPIIKNLEL